MKRVGLFFTREGEEALISEETRKSISQALRSIGSASIVEIEVTSNGFIYQDTVLKNHDLSDHIDYACIAIHGELGEGGGLQKIFEDHHIPYIGTNAYQSSVAFSKAATKAVLESSGIKSATYQVFKRDEIDGKTASHIFTTMPQPCIVKPSTSGSSYGVSKCRTIHEIQNALSEALQYSDTIVVEEFIEGREFFVGVITDFRNKELYMLPAVEAILADGKEFFDTEAKYDGSTNEVCPANINEELSQELQDATKAVCSAIHIRDYARIDFIAHPTRGVFVIEVNTLPGMSSESLFPKAIKTIGLSMRDMFKMFIERL